MKVLWIVNLIPREAAEVLQIRSEVLGGWVESMIGQLRNVGDMQLAVVCKASPGQNFSIEIDGVKYYGLPYSSRTKPEELEKSCGRLLDEFKPDLIQIEGTEFPHAKAMMNAGKQRSLPVVVSMQGILGGQYQYQCGQLPVDEMMWSRSATDIFAAWILHLRKRVWFKPRMKPEREIIEGAEYILGRTTWDRAHSYAINPHAKYYTCSRILREPFYTEKWSPDKMERHSIYVGNGYLALKGLHFVIMALPQLIREYPDVKLYVAGYKPFTEGDRRPFYKRGYGAYLKKLIRDLGVAEHIEFTGPLKAGEVAEKLAKVNVYVLPSAIENSPNTLGEAMMVGTPSVSAYVGGVSDMAEDGVEALFYRNDDPVLLAWNIKRIFDNDELARMLSENGKKKAAETHNAAKNAEALLHCYHDILRG
ncbi:MAG: glycosyltransferase [Clostridia bacterium]|nr:glycosyltransferase [Clostridia bacterium]